MPPEQLARLDIDRQLAASGWSVQDRAAMNLHAGPGVAVREFPLKPGHGTADYLLYADAKAIGVVEAKPVGHSLLGVETQSDRYARGLPDGLPHHALPLPFAYETTGAETRFTNALEPDHRSRRVFAFHRPEELLRLAAFGPDQVRAKLRRMPPVDATGLWDVQAGAVRGLETSLARNLPRALIQMATGSGKTYTACSFCYRLLKFARAKRILFLVDRNNLGRQTLREFQQYRSPYANWTFTEEFPVQHLRRNSLDPAAKVCITTIQRLFSMLKGDADYDEGNEEHSLFESADPALPAQPVAVEYNPNVPIETFDFVVVDECHRSIYNLWRQVLDYFDAFLVGLTATPTQQTVGFFQGNVVQDYSHEKAVADGVNVGFEVFRIETQVTRDGATLTREPEHLVPHRDRRTRRTLLKELDDDLTYTAGQLDRDVVNKNQIRLVLETFRDRLFTEIFPGRSEVPKTLVFCKTDQHADDVVEIAREVFGKGNQFCRKITSKTTGAKPEDLLQAFRNSYDPRIAVTVDMIATGTDVKPLECLLFLRNIRSEAYFEQMKGRGCRVVKSDDLQAVTPDAKHKTHFVIVDAVGVCESPKSAHKPLDRQPSVPLERLLQSVAEGHCHADLVSTLAARLARLAQRATADQAEEIARHAGGRDLPTLAGNLLQSLDGDVNATSARQRFALPDEADPTDEQLDVVEREAMGAALRPFHEPKLRDAILAVRSSEQVVDETTPDALLRAGFDEQAKAAVRSKLDDFRRFLDDHKDEIEAIGVLYAQPYRAGLRFGQVKELAKALARPPLSLGEEPQERLWRLYEAVEPEAVRGSGGRALVDLVALVRHALHPTEPLVPVADAVRTRFAAWLAEQESAGVAFTPEQRRWLEAIRDHVAGSLRIDRDDFEYAPFAQLGGLGKAWELFGDRLAALLEELNGRLAA